MAQRGISQSGLGLYRSCPYAYKLKYLHGYKPMFWNFDVLDIGSYVHEAIDKYYKLRFLTEADSPNDVLYETYDLLKQVWDTTLEPEGFKKAYTSLQNHAQFEYNQIKSGIRSKPFTEVKINARGYFGIIDYADMSSMNIIDWKTNRYPTLSYNYRMQAYIYKQLIDEHFNVDLKYFKFFFLFPNKWRTVKYDTPKMNEVANDVEELKSMVSDSYKYDSFEKRPRTKKMCRNCLYKYYCMKMQMQMIEEQKEKNETVIDMDEWLKGTT